MTPWIFDPAIVIGLGLMAWLYGRGHGAARWEVCCFWAGWVTLVIALVSPLHSLSDQLFSAHMAQHEILMVISAPLLIVGRPLVPLLWSLPMAWRRELGMIGKSRVAGWSTNPTAATVIHGLAIWVWHIPVLFQATLRNEFAHMLQHVSFLATALLFWWALLHGRGGRSGVVHVFVTAVHTTVLGALLTFSPSVWYPAYGTGLADQQLAGLIMWIPAGVVYTLAGLFLFATLLRESDAKLAARVAAALVLCVVCSSCTDQKLEAMAAQMTGGNPARGRAAIEHYGCASCHTIPGVARANGLVGPPLTGIARRVHIGGVVTNSPDNVIRWIQNPKAIDPLTVMPNLGVNYADARDITGYLYTLR